MDNWSACVNITKSCNLGCSWCYQQNQRSNQHLDLEVLPFLKSVFDRLKIVSITLIGGEPTIHPQLDVILQEFSSYEVTLVTNGLAFSDLELLKLCERNNVRTIALSFKGIDKYSFKQNTGVDRFAEFEIALANLRNSSLAISFNFTCSPELLTPAARKEFIQFVQKLQLPFVALSDIRPYFDGGRIFRSYNTIPAFETLCLQCLENGIEVVVRPNNPLCWYSKQFIHTMLLQHRLHVQCAVRSGYRLHFTPNLDLILCNEFHDVLLGQMGRDYITPQQFITYLNSLQDNKLLKKLSAVPSPGCSTCSLWTICGGSCLLHWISKGDMKKCIPWKI